MGVSEWASSLVLQLMGRVRLPGLKAAWLWGRTLSSCRKDHSVHFLLDNPQQFPSLEEHYGYLESQSTLTQEATQFRIQVRLPLLV